MLRNKGLFQACLLVALSTGLVILGDTYATMVFLAEYPAQKLPYFYLAMGVFSIFTTQVVNPWIKKDLTQFIKISHIVILVILFALNRLMSVEMFYTPFVFTVTLATTSLIVNTSYWTAVTEMFDLREYKRLSHIVNTFSTIGGIFVGTIAPILLKFFTPVCLLIFYLLIIAYVRLLINRIEFKKSNIKLVDHNDNVVLEHRGLFRAMFVSILLMIILYTCADFVMKHELATVFNEQQIGTFLAPFYAVVMTITVLCQFFISPLLVRHFGVSGMMSVFPILLLIGSLALIVHTGFWTSVIIGALAQVGRYSFYSNGKQLALNVLPRQARRVANFQLQSLGRNTGLILVALGLAYIASVEAYSLLVYLMVALSILMMLNILPIKKAYYQNLRRAINVHRVSIDYFSSNATDEALCANVIDYAFDQNTTDSILFGLSLITEEKNAKIPKRALTFIDHESKDIQNQVLSLIRSSGDKSHVDFLIKKLTERKLSIDLSWRISDVILGLNPRRFLRQAKNEFTSEQLSTKSRAICAYLLAGKPSQREQARGMLSEMLNSPHPQQRHWAVKILRSTKLSANDEILMPLLKDDHINIRLDAIDVVVNNVRESTILYVINMLFDTHTRGRAARTLVTASKFSLDYLLKKIHQEFNPISLRVLIDVIAQMSSIKAEQAMIQLLNSKRRLIQSIIAFHLVMHTKNHPLSSESKKLIRIHILQMMVYMNTLLHAKNTHPNEIMVFEITFYIERKRCTFLSLLSAWNDDSMITKIIPVLLARNQDHQLYARALELLEMRLKSTEMKKCLTHFMEAQTFNPDFSVVPLQDVDPWFEQIDRYIQGQLTGDDMERVQRMLILRKINLFQNLNTEAIQMIAENVEKLDVSSGEYLFHEGDVVSGLYILAKGSVQMKKGDNLIATYTGPDSFGELALFNDRARSATAISTSDAELFVLDKAAFDHITDEWPEILRVIVSKILTYIDSKE